MTRPTLANRHGSAVVTLPSDREILIVRRFDAPARLVFEAWTNPAHVRRWWGSEDAPLVVCDIDLRVGGSWRYVTRDAGGTELGWHGTYQEIDGPRRLVSTEVFEGYPDGEATNTMTLEETGGVTEMRVVVLHSSVENRDGHIASGMEAGMQVVMDRLEDLVRGGGEVSGVAQRYRTVAGQFTRTAAGVPPAAWDNPAPCEGWVARDVVRHLVEWFPPFLLDGAGITLPSGPPVDEDPEQAWRAMSDGVQALLDDPDSASRRFSHPRAGDHALPDAIDMFLLGDVLIHTWDLARATGQDETLDRAEVESMLAGIEPYDEMLRSSGQYGPRVIVADDADAQTKLIAFVGRQP